MLACSFDQLCYSDGIGCSFIFTPYPNLLQTQIHLFPIINLVLGLQFILLTFSFGNSEKPRESDLSILSFNAKLFRKQKIHDEFSFEMIKWSANDTSDIKCFQEYSTNSRWPVLNVTEQVSEKGYEHFIFYAKLEDVGHNPGFAIFSIYPILDSGFVWKDSGL